MATKLVISGGIEPLFSQESHENIIRCGAPDHFRHPLLVRRKNRKKGLYILPEFVLNLGLRVTLITIHSRCKQKEIGVSLLEKLSRIFSGQATEPVDPEQEKKLAAAALMVEVALQDGDFSDNERHRIRTLLVERLHLPEDQADQLLAEAEAHVENSHQILSFTRTIKDHFDQQGRENIMELLWEVVYADGREDAFESNLMRRIAGLLYVPDRVNGELRRKVLNRRG